MAKSNVRTVLRAALLIAPVILLEVACSRPPEQQTLNQFFRAVRSGDSTTLSMMSAVSLSRTQGTVEDFEIVTVGPEQRAPLGLQAYVEAVEAARTAEAEFQQQKKAYSDANLKTIEEILKLEGNPNAKLTREQEAVKPVWDKWRADTAMHVKNLSTAESALMAATVPIEVSLDQPGQPAFDMKTFEGEMVSKDVALKADVRSPDGQVSEKDVVVTMSRVAGTQAGTPREGKWIITKLAGL